MIKEMSEKDAFLTVNDKATNSIEFLASDKLVPGKIVEIALKTNKEGIKITVYDTIQEFYDSIKSRKLYPVQEALRKIHPLLYEKYLFSILLIHSIQFVSVWDGDEISSNATINIHTGEIQDIEKVDISNEYKALDREFIRYSNHEYDVIEFNGTYYAKSFLPRLSRYYDLDIEEDNIEDDIEEYNIGIPKNMILLDKGSYIEAYGNPHGKKSKIPDGESVYYSCTGQGKG
jgi:hypothetical protein